MFASDFFHEDPTYDHTQWESPGELMADLLQNKTPTPFWIEFGRTRHRITPETREQVARGILIAIEKWDTDRLNAQDLRVV